ncbi:MAG: hypothetical protein DCF19_24305 [Pseudanabaena frigida]|uniref:Uncharacterized protein n=1 Tax=Pseudanabaena frigida TaxID=945775 RepID=A0A2W4XKV9_9CYAN|nr:MAG: hypothetical protein DCF19_24305 [Pseudanabaena frigida]
MKVSALVLLTSTVIGTVAFNPSIASAGEVYNRLENQQDRIQQGIRDGQINYREYKNLERREASINNQRLADLRRDGGHLTTKDYRQLNREENRVSNAIYRDRHN